MKNQLISNEELLVSNMLEILTIIRILTRKGITTEHEIKKLNREMTEKIRRMSKEVTLIDHLSGG